MSLTEKADLKRDFAAGVYQNLETGSTVGIFDPAL